jgi:hypothetical protein
MSVQMNGGFAGTLFGKAQKYDWAREPQVKPGTRM